MDQRLQRYASIIDLYETLMENRMPIKEFRELQRMSDDQIDKYVDQLSEYMKAEEEAEANLQHVFKRGFDKQIKGMMNDYGISMKEALDREIESAEVASVEELLYVWCLEVNDWEEYLEGYKAET